MQKISISADELAEKLLALDARFGLCLLDSCGIDHFGSHLLIAGMFPVATDVANGENGTEIVRSFSDLIASTSNACIFTISYEVGLGINNIESCHTTTEPHIFISQFENLIVHDYKTGETFISGDERNIAELSNLLNSEETTAFHRSTIQSSKIKSNFSREEYIAAVNEIKNEIVSGNTYQTNLTQQITVSSDDDLNAEQIFLRLRSKHPAPFSAFLRRGKDTVISASPERFLKIDQGEINVSPIKGTRRRGDSVDEDNRLKNELITSEKDRAENVMIVDLLRNDIGRVCDFGTVEVTELCKLYEHPTLFHLVSTIKGKLRPDADLGSILNAAFPCGSITGAPKISTMKIIDRIEKSSRGLSMGAIGVYIPKDVFELPETLDMSVAIRTMSISGNEAVFNVGGGITIDSIAEEEYDESLLKAKALLSAIDAKLGLSTELF